MSENINLPSAEDVQEWKKAGVIKFLQENKDKLDLDDDDIDIIKKNKVTGPNFLLLSKDELLAHPYNLPAGPATTIVELVKKIKDEGQEQKLQVAPSLLVAPEDITVEIIKQLTRSPDQLPHKPDLANFLNENPLVKIPLSPNHYYQFSTTGRDAITKNERDTYFTLSTEAECTSLYSRLLGQLIYPPSYGQTEDSYHFLWDCVIKNTIETFGMHSASLPTLEFDRNTSKRTSTGRNRPDMFVLVRNVCPFRGEEKSREEAGDPSSELTDKIKDWTYGDAPYILAYYAIGVQITFVALYKPENKKRKMNICSERIAEFHLGCLSDRIRIMNFLRNICRILPIIVNLCPPRDSPEFQTIVRTNGTVIELGYAIKKKFANEDRVTHLKEIYGILSSIHLHILLIWRHVENNVNQMISKNYCRH
ncbi:serine/threonine protein kinase [Gigaspora margarita]|uniref:Serine/threonine protein kinase n=1 Tax=Gigaspora margarita TaxID=4874 RepID=A0A8H4AUU0_GIGMA|nr:serine/threonine protein kinase [Gigaspora margarita]